MTNDKYIEITKEEMAEIITESFLRKFGFEFEQNEKDSHFNIYYKIVLKYLKEEKKEKHQTHYRSELSQKIKKIARQVLITDYSYNSVNASNQLEELCNYFIEINLVYIN